MKCYAPALVFLMWALLFVAGVLDPMSNLGWGAFFLIEAAAFGFYIHQVRKR